MNNEEINRYIHVEIMGKCWHEFGPKVFDPSDKSRTGRVCPNCRSFFRDEQKPNNPEYCSDDSPRRLLNEVEANVIEHLRLTVKNPNVIYCRYLTVVNGFSYEDLGYLYEQVIRSTAEQRARACVEAHKLTAKPAA